MRVLLTRDEGNRVDADGRAAIANNNKADLFISLHANGSPRPTLRGAVIYTLSLDRVGEDARRQSQADRAVLPVFGGGSREVALVEWELAQAAHLDGSNAFAGIVDQKLRTTAGLPSVALQRAPMRNLAGTNMPAVLIEMGYLSNAEEETAAHVERIPERHRPRADRGGRRVPRSSSSRDRSPSSSSASASAMKKKIPRGFGLYVGLAAVLVMGLITAALAWAALAGDPAGAG